MIYRKMATPPQDLDNSHSHYLESNSRYLLLLLRHSSIFAWWPDIRTFGTAYFFLPAFITSGLVYCGTPTPSRFSSSDSLFPSTPEILRLT